MTKWGPHTDCEGSVYRLAHFNDAINEYVLPPTITRPRARTVAAKASYGLHCFTRKQREGENPRDCDVYRKNAENRVFCRERYELGKQLPDIVRTIANRNCYLTDRRNRVLFSPVQPDCGDDYAIFFVLGRASESTGWNANLMIISAHSRKGFKPGGRPDKFRDLLRMML